MKSITSNYYTSIRKPWLSLAALSLMTATTIDTTYATNDPVNPGPCSPRGCSTDETGSDSSEETSFFYKINLGKVGSPKGGNFLDYSKTAATQGSRGNHRMVGPNLV